MDIIVLNNRYQLLDKIGSGGMAHVYKALDTTLDRTVAIKILKEEFLEDEEFIKRFHAEALAVAKLSNPNIVGVYDVALEGKYHYIVMEYIDGVTLSDYIINKKILSNEETMSVSIQICKALVHAHSNNIIHRDIKPHNVMLTKDGVAKVTDFGIAKATTNKTMTLSGRTIGSVHYFSPEQARGGYVDYRTDLYSLGCVMYEMLTGEVPYEGETPVVVAVKHIQEPVKLPKNINEKVSDEINSLVFKAMSKSADERYQSSQVLLEVLESIVNEKELPKQFDLTLNSVNKVDEKDRATKDFNNMKLKKEIREEYDFTLRNKRQKKYVFAKIIGIFSAILLILVLSFYGIKELITTIIPEVATYEVANYRNMEYEKVKEKLENDFNIIIEKHEVYNNDVIKDIIIDQSIAPGIVFKELGINKIKFTVSLGPELIEIEDYTAFDYRIAERDLEELGLIPIKKEVTSENVAKGGIIRTDPEAGMEVSPHAEITIYVSKGPNLEEVVVPDFIGMNIQEYDEKLEANNLVRGEVIPSGDISETAKIISQVPKVGEVVYENAEVHVVFEEENIQGDRLIVKYILKPLNMEELPNPVKVYVEVLPTDTLKYTEIYNQMHSLSDFPLEVEIPIPIDGKSTIKVIYDNKHTEYYELLYDDYKDREETTIVVPDNDNEGGN